MDFTQALNMPAYKIKKPKPLPVGTYTWNVIKAPVTRETGKNKEWTVVEFPIRPIAPEADVDEDELAAFGNLNAGVNRVSFMFPTEVDEENQNDFDRALHNLKTFLVECLQVPVDDADEATLQELLAHALNCQFMAQVTHDQDKERPDVVYTNVKNWSAAS